MSDVGPFDQDNDEADELEQPDEPDWPAPQPDPEVEPSHGDTTETGDDGGTEAD